MIIHPYLPIFVIALLLNITPEEVAIARFFPEENVYHTALLVADCESHIRQFEDDGVTPLKNREGSSAIGIFQIMASIHEPMSKKVGIDIRTTSGNAQFARYLYDHEGWDPWLASDDCHKKISKK